MKECLTAREILCNLVIQHKGDWDSVYHALVNKETATASVEKPLVKDFITILDKEYPETLKQTHKPPFVLFYKGDIGLIKDIDRNILVNGTRTPTAVGEIMAKKVLGKGLNRNLVIGSGKGLNKLAIASGKTIGVLGYGINYAYDKDLESCDLVISEYPDNVEPDQTRFMDRARIMVGLSKNVLIMESSKKGLSAPLVCYALNLGKDVYVIPNAPDDDEHLNNELIYEGAIPITKQEQLLNLLEGAR